MLRETTLQKISDKALPFEELALLLKSHLGNTSVEATVAMNISLRTSVYDTPCDKNDPIVEILTHLAHSTDISARWAVAKNRHTPIHILEALSFDTINLVRALVATNPNTPPAILKRLFNDEKIVRDGLSGNPATPPKYLTILADDSDAMVRLRVLENPASTKAICKKLLTDTNENVRIAAHIKLQRLNHVSAN